MQRFTLEVIIPAGCLLVTWMVSMAVVLHGGIPHWLEALPQGRRSLVESAILAGTALIVVAFFVFLAVRFTSRLASEVGYLARMARKIASEELPQAVERLLDGGLAPDQVSVTPPKSRTTAEVVTAAAAIVNIHDSAVAAAAAEAGLRDGLRKVLIALGRRNQSLVHRQLRIIDRLEQQTSSSSELAELFALDHLTTRMRRHAESLTVLAGEAHGRAMSRPVPVVDVMRAAAAEIEDYKRVVVRSDAQEAIAAPAVTDLIHLLAELIENATLFSPSSTKIEVRAESVANGFVVEVEDRGLGMPPEQLSALNERLSDPPDIDLADADRLGLFVAGKLAARHGVQVSLAPSAYRGTKAIVILPADIIRESAVEDSLPGVSRQPSAGQGRAASQSGTGSQSGRLNLRAPGVLKLASDSQDGTEPQDNAAARSDKGPQPQGTAGTIADAGWELSVRRRPRRGQAPEPPQAPAGTSGFDAADPGQPRPTAGRPPLPRRVPPGDSGHAARAGRSADAVLPRGDAPPASSDAQPIASDRIGRAGTERKLRQAPDSPLPEDARSLAASVQLSWRTSRDGDDPATGREN